MLFFIVRLIPNKIFKPRASMYTKVIGEIRNMVTYKKPKISYIHNDVIPVIFDKGECPSTWTYLGSDEYCQCR